MKRLHVSLNVDNLEESTRFYQALFGTEPTMVKDDYRQWIIDDPSVNFSIAQGSSSSTRGIAHLGIQNETEAELQESYARVDASAGEIYKEGETTCCYAKSEKEWVLDPQNVMWEVFLTHDRIETFGSGPETPVPAAMPVEETPDAAPFRGCC